jgi:hypothetical protein
VLYTAAVDAGREPPASAIAPEVAEYLLPYIQIFWLLSSCRIPGPSGLGPIPWDSIDRYARRYEINDEILYDDLIAYITAMDSKYLEINAAAMKKEMDKVNKPGKKSSGQKLQSSQW